LAPAPDAIKLEIAVGIDVQALNLLISASRHGKFGRTITLGRQCIHMQPARVEAKLGGKFNFKYADYCEPLLQSHFGATVTDSMDATNYEQATILHDLNKPFPEPALRYETVIDFGTLEHVFNVPEALKTIWSLCEEGGQILHLVPSNNFCGHGFWQFSPELFFSLYRRKNGFEQTEIFLARPSRCNTWYRVMPPFKGQRINIRTMGEVYVMVRTVMNHRPQGEVSVQQSDYVELWDTRAGPQATGLGSYFRGLAGTSGLRKLYADAYWRMTGWHPNLSREYPPRYLKLPT
jgi:hypothetical protein